MTSMYAAVIHNAIQSSDVCCERSLNTIRLLLLACTQLRARPERQRGAVSRVQTASFALTRSPIQRRFVRTKDQSSVSSAAILENAPQYNFKDGKNDTEWGFHLFPSCECLSVCVLCWLICVFMWVCSCVGVGA